MFSARFSAKFFRQLRFFPHHPALAALMLLNSHLTPLAGESGWSVVIQRRTHVIPPESLSIR